MNSFPLLNRRLLERARGGLAVDQVLRVGAALSNKPNWTHGNGRKRKVSLVAGDMKWKCGGPLALFMVRCNMG